MALSPDLPERIEVASTQKLENGLYADVGNSLELSGDEASWLEGKVHGSCETNNIRMVNGSREIEQGIKFVLACEGKERNSGNQGWDRGGSVSTQLINYYGNNLLVRSRSLDIQETIFETCRDQGKAKLFFRAVKVE